MEPSIAAGVIFVHCGNQSTGLSGEFIFPSLEADLKNRRDALAAYLATLAPKSSSNEDSTP